MAEAPKSVTLIDDDESMCQALTRLFTASGFAVHSYFSAEAYLDAWAGAPATDYMVVDVGLPGISGIELIEHLRASLPDFNTPVVFISAHDEIEIHRRAERAGGVAFLKKPFLGQTIITTFRNLP